MKNKYITIEREYGSGGTKIAQLLAKELGLPCYGKEILEKVSKSQGVPYDMIESYEETVTSSFLYSVYMMSQVSQGSKDLLTKDGHIYMAELDVIKDFAKNGPAVFIGHCALEALKEFDNVVNVFIQCTDEETKKNRIIEDYNVPEKQIDSVRKRYDKKRSNYFHSNTGKKWHDMKNYDIVLDSGKIGIDGCVKVLKELME